MSREVVLDKINESPTIIVSQRMISICGGSHVSAAFLSKAMDWDEVYGGEFCKTNSDWQDELCMTNDVFDSARRLASRFVTVKKKGMPAKNYYTVKWDELESAYLELETTEPNKQKNFLCPVKWKLLRKKVLSTYPSVCMRCGAKKEDGIVIHIDHIKPRSKYPDLQYEFDNLQVLCNKCNLLKFNKDETDYRKIKQNVNEENCYA